MSVFSDLIFVLSNYSEDVGSLDMLEYIDLSHNELQSLPSGIGFLTKCTKIVASHNKLVENQKKLVFCVLCIC